VIISLKKARLNQELNQLTKKKSIVKDTDAEGSSSYVDLDKANLNERSHGRTERPLGPDHEPGTV